ncbi:MAG: hypothetical protein E5V37_18460 [Mesorhizobium sp.]|nr:MAG: hypothetical protein E5V37_18460 [Mesorhizobium sp.]
MEHTIKLSDEHLNIIGIALAELPFKIAQPVMAAIQAQLEAQAQATAGATESNAAGVSRKKR